MVPIFDLHADVLMDLVRRDEAFSKSHNADRRPAPELEERHLSRMRAGGVAGAALADCRMAGEPAGPEHLESFIAVARRELAAAWPGAVTVLRAADLRGAMSSGAFAAVVCCEGLSATLGDIGWLWRLYGEAGLRVASLTHNDDNPFGCGALGSGGGLTEKGREALAAMNRLGILVDMAHAGAATRRDILAASSRPVMLSHTSCAAVYDNGRNLSDEALRDIADAGGLVGCMTSPAALAPAGDRANHSLERYMEHLNHMIGAAGVEHVGLGLHFCEYLYTREEYPLVSGLEDASRAQAIIDALLASGYSQNEVEKIAWRNFARVFEDAAG
ncbi:dipeptidase [bacterium]|nr:dipeptidase [bacterium]